MGSVGPIFFFSFLLGVFFFLSFFFFFFFFFHETISVKNNTLLFRDFVRFSFLPQDRGREHSDDAVAFAGD